MPGNRHYDVRLFKGSGGPPSQDWLILAVPTAAQCLATGSDPHNRGTKDCDDQPFDKYRFCFQNIQGNLAIKLLLHSTSEIQKD